MESRIVTASVLPSSGAARIPELDGVRALAVLAVMLNHLLVAAPALVAHAPSGLPSWLEKTFNAGWLGVDLFFMLSGFLITSILLESKDNGPARYFGGFYERRALRILPLYLFLLAILAVAYVPKTGPAYFALCLAFAANLAPLTGAFVPNGGGPMWSLAVEEQFYLLWPLLVLVLDRRKLWLVLLTVVLIEPVLRAGQSDLHLQLTWFRCDGLAWGALLALWFSSPRRNRRSDDRLALGLVGLALAIILVGIPFGGMHAGTLSNATRIVEALCLFAALIIFAVSRSGTSTTKLLRAPFALATASFSYCLYLIHVPLIDAYQTIGSRFFPGLPDAIGPLGANLLRAGIIFVVAYVLAALSRRYLELPFLRMGRRQRRPAPVGSPLAS